MEKLTEFPIPSIASVNGPAVAGGCQLVAACDLAISAKSAIFSASSIKLGLFCSTPGVSLVRAIGLRAANELLLTGNQYIYIYIYQSILYYSIGAKHFP